MPVSSCFVRKILCWWACDINTISFLIFKVVRPIKSFRVFSSVLGVWQKPLLILTFLTYFLTFFDLFHQYVFLKEQWIRPFLIFPVLLKTIQVRLCNCLIQEYSFSFYDLIRILKKSSHFGSDGKERITNVASGGIK